MKKVDRCLLFLGAMLAPTSCTKHCGVVNCDVVFDDVVMLFLKSCSISQLAQKSCDQSDPLLHLDGPGCCAISIYMKYQYICNIKRYAILIATIRKL